MILADSLGQNIRYIHNTDTFFFPGCTISALKHKLLSGEIDITKYQYINLIIGTNDLTPKSVWFHFKREIKKGNSGFNLPIHLPTATPVITSAYTDLVLTIRRYNSNAKLIVYGILPRPFDNHRNKAHHTEVNVELNRICKDNNIIFVKTNKPFMRYGIPRPELFSDGLHLSTKGNRHLNRLISNTVNNLRSDRNTQLNNQQRD